MHSKPRKKHPYGCFLSYCAFLITTHISGLVALGVGTEHIVVAGQDGVEEHAEDGSDGKAGQGDGCAAHGEGDAAHGGEAQTGDEHDGGDNEVAGLGQVNAVLHDVADTDSGNHTVQDEADTAHDSGDLFRSCYRE